MMENHPLEVQDAETNGSSGKDFYSSSDDSSFWQHRPYKHDQDIPIHLRKSSPSSTWSSTDESEPEKLEYATDGKKLDPDLEKLSSLISAVTINSSGLACARTNDFQKAVKHWKSAAKLGNQDANFNLGLAYEKGLGVEKGIEKASKYYREAAKRGHGKACYNLAMLYLEGLGGVQRNEEKALRCLQIAAISGLSVAQTQLGVLYTEDKQRNLSRAAGWFQMAARQKDVDAQYYFGVCFEYGWGVTEDKSNAYRWYLYAAKAGHVTAKYKLGVFHEHALGGLKVDQTEALEWYMSAAGDGHREAMAAVKRIKNNDMEKPNKDDSGIDLDELDPALDCAAQSTTLRVAMDTNPSDVHQVQDSLSNSGSGPNDPQFSCGSDRSGFSSGVSFSLSSDSDKSDSSSGPSTPPLPDDASDESSGVVFE